MKAIYARQSVERPDSISIEMQIESCQKLLEPSEEPLVFLIGALAEPIPTALDSKTPECGQTEAGAGCVGV